MTRFPTFILAVLVLPAFAEEESVVLPEKYQAVVDRFPFGQPPEGFDPLSKADPRYEGAEEAAAAEPEVPLTQQQEALKHVVHASVLVINPVTRDPWLGFSDATDPKSPRNYYLPVGGTQDDWTVKSVDTDKKSAVVAKGDVEIELVVGAMPEKGKGPADRKGGRLVGAPISGFRPPSPAAPNAASDAAQPAAPSSLASLRRQRIERDAAQRQQLEEARRARVAALDAARRQQEETERQRAAARAEDDSRRAQEREEREAERAAEREEYNQRVKNLAAQLEAQMIENRRKRLAESNSNDDE